MEHEFIRWLTERTNSTTQAQRVLLGIGDDAAILRAGDERLVLASDMIAEGTHFLVKEHELELIGRKAIAVNLSDLAAMAAEPLACLLNLQLPKTFGLEQAQQLFNGAQTLADEFNFEIIGGDTNRWDGGLVVAVTAVGQQTVSEGWRLKGAQVGDHILVTGSLGGSILGRHLTFTPRVNLAVDLAAKFNIHAATDISDSLTTDLLHMTTEKLGIQIDLDKVPISDAAFARSNKTGRPPLEHALSDGEDFELLLSASPSVADQITNLNLPDVSITKIGEVIGQPGLWQMGPDGSTERLSSSGYEH